MWKQVRVLCIDFFHKRRDLIKDFFFFFKEHLAPDGWPCKEINVWGCVPEHLLDMLILKSVILHINRKKNAVQWGYCFILTVYSFSFSYNGFNCCRFCASDTYIFCKSSLEATCAFLQVLLQPVTGRKKHAVHPFCCEWDLFLWWRKRLMGLRLNKGLILC